MVEYQRLDEVCNINMGQSPASISYNEYGEGLPFFQGNADFGELYPNVRIWCSAPTKIVEPKTLLVSVRAPIGALNFSLERSCIGRGLAGITPVSGVKLKYVYYCLKGKNAELNAKGTGSTFKAIAKTTLGEIPIRMIPVAEQQKVIQVLDKVSEIINQHKQQLAALNTLIRARFVEMFGDPVNNPKGWKETTIGTECHYIKDGPHKSLPDVGKGNGYPFISARNIVNGYIDFSTAKHISEQDYHDAIRKCHPQKGDMLYSKGGTTGIAKLIDVDDEFANWVHVAVLKFGNSLNGVFFENMLNSAYCYDQSQRLTKGIANRDLVLSSMAQIKMYKPPIELQNQFSAFVAQVDKSKVA